MIGIYIKNFKCYQGTHFINCFSSNQASKFVSYLGNNGVGKTAILEAIDVFFSKKPHWYRNKDAKKGSQDCFVAPVFLVENKKYPKIILDVSDRLCKIIKDVSIPMGYVLVAITRREDGVFTIYDGKKELVDDEYKREATKIYGDITKDYKYVYIDAEIDIDEQARINSEIYELIIGSSIISAVEKKFKERDKDGLLVNGLNQTLETLIDNELTTGLKQINSEYSYGGSKGAISRLTTNILAMVSTQAFLNARKIKYKNKTIDTLSSGQRRMALLDFIIAIIKNKIIGNSKKFILAIDEPEISLDSSIKMSQFERLLEIAKENIQVMITSHWYGWIPMTDAGRSVLIEDHVDGKKEMICYENKNFPFKDLPKYEMRMIFDFLISLGASAESNKNTKYIICEGISDRIYFQASLKDNSYKIIPIGKGRVKRMAEIFKNYFWKDSGPTLKNILFVIDTDPEQRDGLTTNNCYLKRWSKDIDLKVTLVSVNDNDHNKCIIEDILEPEIFIDALKIIYPESFLISELSIKHPGSFGIDAFGLDSISIRSFYKETKDRKVDLALEYKRLLELSTKDTRIKKLITEVI